ncbi:hypothetical protein OUS_0763 [Helicobacter pylori R056a]|uniref:Uncharacterized protein n=1 Tax=Helicobacter pylori R018c TaxID=1145110 RepID=K2KB09_HELPX|nr:hypothetical protein OUC_0795 [Helicobacter pylori R018c]EKE95278.1 hypothetical protein OUS_0763 [Helicobacter pylori R056a]
MIFFQTDSFVATMPPFNICYIIREREKSRGLIKKRLYFD